jgi:hypothetical protein
MGGAYVADQIRKRRIRRDRKYDALVSLRLSGADLRQLDQLADALERSRNSLLREGVDLVLRAGREVAR